MMFTAVTKIWDFIVKRSDKELDEVISSFNKFIIKDSLTKVKNLKNITHEDLKILRNNLNLPIEFKNLRKEVIKYGKLTYGLVIAAGAFSILSFLFPKFNIKDFTFLLGAFVLWIIFLVYFVNYWQSLSQLRDSLENLESKIQDSESVI